MAIDAPRANRKQCDVVSNALVAGGYPDIPVIPALCFVDAYLPLREKNRRVKGVWLCSPRSLPNVVGDAGPLDDGTRFAIAMALSTSLSAHT